MLRLLKYRWELYKLEKEYNRIDNTFTKQAKNLSVKERDLLRSEVGSEIWPVHEKIEALKTRRFRHIAYKLMVPLPESKDKELWDDLQYVRGKALTNKGYWKLKKIIRQEKRERREGWIVWLTVLIGIIGALTGLAAVLRR